MHICYIYNMSRRTSIILDQESEDAARELARIYGCSSSEAIRRAVVRQHDLLKGLPSKAIKERKKVLFRLFELFEDPDAGSEIDQLKKEDVYF